MRMATLRGGSHASPRAVLSTGSPEIADAVFEHPRLVAIYDALDADRSDLDLYVVGKVESWVERIDVSGPLVSFAGHGCSLPMGPSASLSRRTASWRKRVARSPLAAGPREP
jgi:hypothetical protein